jgi:zinc/manganese transport system permease protein
MFQYEFMVNAFEAAGIVAVVSGLVGFFLVMRGQTFAGHALSHIGFAGATGAGLIGLAPLWGLVGFTLAAGIAMGALSERISNRDVAIGVVLALALGFGLLFLHYYTSFATQATALLFGNVLAVDRDTIVTLAALGAVTLIALGAIMRPLIFASLQPELAEAKGVPLRFISTAFLAIVALAVSACAQIVGVLLVFTLMVGPPAAAQRLTSGLWSGLGLAALLALAEACLGITVAFHTDWPVSFCIALLSGPFLNLAFDELAEIRGRRAIVGDDLRAESLQTLAHGRRLHRLDDGVVEFLYDGIRRTLRQKHGVPRIGLHIETLFRGGRQVRLDRRTRLGHDGNGLDAAAVDLRFGGADDLAKEIDTSTNQVLHGRAGALVRHMHDVGAHGGVEHDAAKMRCRARAGGTELHLGLVGLGVSNEFLEIVRREILARDQHDRNFRDQGDRREIVRGIVDGVLVERLVLRVSAHGAQDDGVTVRAGVGHALGPVHAAGATDIFDHHGLTENVSHARRDDAAEQVRRSAGREWNHHGHWPRRKVLGSGRACERQQHCQGHSVNCSFHVLTFPLGRTAHGGP